MATRSVWRLAPVLLVASFVAEPQAQVPVVVPTAGMVIDSSVRLRPGTYRLPALVEGAALTIRGNGITVDMTGVTIEGADPLADPDGYRGTGVLIDGGSKVTVQGAVIRGYKVGILARKSPGLHLTRNDLSYNWKARLWSGIEKESLVDWMSYHNNEKDEWLRYGAAIYLSECDEAEIDHNRAVQGQNGLMVTKSSRLKIWNNTFSWLSAVGLGMYRTTDSTIAHNTLDWNVRGYSHGFYYRGQDSTAILMYEQSSRNILKHNSATHGGDGLFLWAGQSTMDTGMGGANDNTFHGNDFSHAVANGIETTFSRNTFTNNRVDDCWHGVWGGYSFDSVFSGNHFNGNDEAITIEHGQNNRIEGNHFNNNGIGIRLWANPTQDPNWGYPKNRDTRSRDYHIVGNDFFKGKTVFDVRRTLGITFEKNILNQVGVGYELREVSAARIADDIVLRPEVLWRGDESLLTVAFSKPTLTDDERKLLESRGAGMVQVPGGSGTLPGGMNALLPEGARRGRSTIIVDEWGPYDYRSPKVWPAGSPYDRPLKLRVLGPPGRWTLVSAQGATVNVKAGDVPSEIIATPAGSGADVRLTFEYVGAEVVTSRGVKTAGGRTHRFTYELFEPAIDWNVRMWTWEDAADPLKAPDAYAARLATPPTVTTTMPRLHLVSGGALAPNWPRDRVAIRAEGVVTLPAGQFDLFTLSDDGIRVWIDDKLVIDRWSIHGTEVDHVPITAGRHRVRVEYFEATGWAELRVGFRHR